MRLLFFVGNLCADCSKCTAATLQINSHSYLLSYFEITTVFAPTLLDVHRLVCEPADSDYHMILISISCLSCRSGNQNTGGMLESLLFNTMDGIFNTMSITRISGLKVSKLVVWTCLA
ncbi:hypothetical protein DUNSADRAFT_10013 [Dunaliella salina]|uniref:Encoded protein n=1 Tax=Dunaliella salina TaxID=3046 RepID=A0ABQ7GG95_DUNSA|nr:hypothetical protein DUNSADRAFT_10013 [Dunaliella salina]|eukprot:KAF5833634.1 hypothetical protein DUNSADRAFT_10013 [Dunaliella salina]